MLNMNELWLHHLHSWTLSNVCLSVLTHYLKELNWGMKMNWCHVHKKCYQCFHHSGHFSMEAFLLIWILTGEGNWWVNCWSNFMGPSWVVNGNNDSIIKFSRATILLENSLVLEKILLTLICAKIYVHQIWMKSVSAKLYYVIINHSNPTSSTSFLKKETNKVWSQISFMSIFSFDLFFIMV